MPRGFRGNNRASPRGRGRGRGFSRGRGRGGGFQHNLLDDEMDFVVQMWPQNNSGGSTPRRGGRGGARGSNPDSGRATPNRGRGSSQAPRASASFNSPTRGRGVGRGRGAPPQKLPTSAPLSKLLLAERPLLKPVFFVRSVHTATLFQEEEELVNNVAEEIDESEQNHVPTAERVTQIFNGASISDNDNDELEEVDFDDLARIRAEVDAAPINTGTVGSSKLAEDQFTGYYAETKVSSSSVVEATSATVSEQTVEQVTQDVFYVDTNPAPVHGSDSTHPPVTSVESVEIQLNVISIEENTPLDVNMVPPDSTESKDDLFYVDTTPAAVPPEMAPSHVPVVPEQPPLDDDDVIVYLAPHPRRATPAVTPKVQPPPLPPTPPAHESVSFSFANSPAPKIGNRKAPTINTPRGKRQALKAARQRAARMPKRRTKGGFSDFGAMLSEARLHDEEENRDPLFEERRRGDSDIDWGDKDESGDGVAEGMQLDDDLLDDKAMKSFVQSMSPGGSRWMGAGDIEDMQRIRAEDEDDGENATDSESEGSEDGAIEMEAIFEAEERVAIGEDSDSEDIEESDDEEEDASPKSSFQARLDRIRKNARTKKARHVPVSSEEEDDYDGLGPWADDEEDLIAGIEDILAENEAILTGRDRKKRDRLFQAIRDGDFDADELDEVMFLPVNKKAKRSGLPAELAAQWDKDRSKKAERKRMREQAKLLAAADPLTTKKGGKKGRKAMLAAARLAQDPITVLPNQIMSMITLEQQIRRFLADLGGRNEMSLPPMDKGTRKKVHEMANAFNLKSVSKGSGKTRYTTLIKTTKSGFVINEKKVARITKMDRGWSAPGDWGGGGKGKLQLPKHRDGDEVGKAAPKIGESNIGFQMLAAMGWSEGDRIGISGGLDAPLTAIIKNTKLGLGATR